METHINTPLLFTLPLQNNIHTQDFEAAFLNCLDVCNARLCINYELYELFNSVQPKNNAAQLNHVVCNLIFYKRVQDSLLNAHLPEAYIQLQMSPIYQSYVESVLFLPQEEAQQTERFFTNYLIQELTPYVDPSLSLLFNKKYITVHDDVRSNTQTRFIINIQSLQQEAIDLATALPKTYLELRNCLPKNFSYSEIYNDHHKVTKYILGTILNHITDNIVQLTKKQNNAAILSKPEMINFIMEYHKLFVPLVENMALMRDQYHYTKAWVEMLHNRTALYEQIKTKKNQLNARIEKVKSELNLYQDQISNLDPSIKINGKKISELVDMINQDILSSTSRLQKDALLNQVLKNLILIDEKLRLAKCEEGEQGLQAAHLNNNNLIRIYNEYLEIASSELQNTRTKRDKFKEILMSYNQGTKSTTPYPDTLGDIHIKPNKILPIKISEPTTISTQRILKKQEITKEIERIKQKKSLEKFPLSLTKEVLEKRELQVQTLSLPKSTQEYFEKLYATTSTNSFNHDALQNLVNNLREKGVAIESRSPGSGSSHYNIILKAQEGYQGVAPAYRPHPDSSKPFAPHILKGLQWLFYSHGYTPKALALNLTAPKYLEERLQNPISIEKIIEKHQTPVAANTSNKQANKKKQKKKK